VIEFAFTDPRLTAEVRAVTARQGGSVWASIDFLLDSVPVFSDIAVWTDAAVRYGVAKYLSERCDLSLEELVGDLLRLERQLAFSVRILSAASRDRVSAESGRVSAFPFRTARDLAVNAPSDVVWIAKPWLAQGAITEVTGKVKSAGKTTWATHMAAAIVTGRPFMGEPTRKGPVVYLTEQPDSSFHPALRRASLLDREDFVVLSWKDVRSLSWTAVVDAVIEKSVEVSAVAMFVDTLTQFAGIPGDGENNAGEALAAMEPLQRAAAKGIGVVSIRHDRKAGGEVGDSGRGSSAFAGVADIVLSIRRPEGNQKPTIRVIHSLGRFDETPERWAIELTARGYVSLGEGNAFAVASAKQSIVRVAPREEENAKELGVLCEEAGVRRTTAQDVVKELLAAGELRSVGRGKKGDPHKYWQP
jgi:hypothetical protein